MKKNIIFNAALVASFLVVSGFALTQRVARAVLVRGVIPQSGLLLHLDGLNPANSATTWVDKSGNGNDATMVNATFNPGVGYTYNGSSTTGTLGSGVAAQAADSFAYMIRASFTDVANAQSNNLQARLLGQNWNHISYEYNGNDSVIWSVNNNDLGNTGGTHFRGGSNRLRPSVLGSSENMIGVSWVADSPGSYYGTARLYANGSFVKEVTSAVKPDNIHNTNLSRTMSIGSTSWTGTINEVAIYANFVGTPDQLMMDVFTGLDVPPAPEPSSLVLLGFGVLALRRRRRR
jgi:hypothetical protein